AAARCANRIQNALAEYEQRTKELPVKVRIGAAAGEPVENHHDLFGSTVQLAARLCAHAQPEQSLVSNVVAELCIGKGLTFQDLGEVTLRGFDQPIRVHVLGHIGAHQSREPAPRRAVAGALDALVHLTGLALDSAGSYRSKRRAR